MTISISNTVLALTELCLFFTLVIAASQHKNCVCPGPTKYYEELGCTPVFNHSESCCPIRYNCDHWKNLPAHKCFLNGHIYESGEDLREEDKNPCDSCQCMGPGFACVVSSCLGPNYNCYLKMTPFHCCGGKEVCPEKDEDRPTCIVDGKTYKDGEFFVPSTEPEKHCYCGEGYTGENVEPFCAAPKHTWCSNVLYNAAEIRNDCAPIYRFGSSPQKDCNLYFRCQNDMDVVINRANQTPKSETSEPEDPDMLCHFGNLTMRVGDELNQDTDYFTTCLKCVCEVPPVPTCQRRSEEECSAARHILKRTL